MTRYAPHRRRRDVASKHQGSGSWFTCGGCGKRGYLNKRAARTAQRDQARDNDRAGLEPVSVDAQLRPYRCQSTQAWHIGYETPRGRANLNDPRLNFLTGDGAA